MNNSFISLRFAIQWLNCNTLFLTGLQTLAITYLPDENVPACLFVSVQKLLMIFARFSCLFSVSLVWCISKLSYGYVVFQSYITYAAVLQHSSADWLLLIMSNKLVAFFFTQHTRSKDYKHKKQLSLLTIGWLWKEPFNKADRRNTGFRSLLTLSSMSSWAKAPLEC